MPTRSYARNFILANWLGIPFAPLQVNRHLTGLEGRNGAGKTTFMAGYVTAIIPNQRLLNFPNVGADGKRDGNDAGLWGRLGELGTAYSIIEWINPEGRSIWAGVTLTRGPMPSIDIKPFTVEGLPSSVDPYEAFLVRENGTPFVPTFSRLRDHLTMLGGRVTAHRTIADYLRTLFEHGITPLPMSSYDEQERFYRVLATSMMGSSLGAIAKTGLRNYLLTEDATLERRVTNMRNSLEQCRQTKRELERTERAHDEIHGIFDAAWRMASYAYFGALARFEQANEAWRSQVFTTRRIREEHADLQTLFGELERRLVELNRKEAEGSLLVEVRKTTLDLANEALETQHKIKPASESLTIAQQSYAQAAQAQQEAEATESGMDAELDAARSDHTSIASEMADLNIALEALMQRVIRLNAARKVLARAQAIVGKDVTERNARARKSHLEATYKTLTGQFNSMQAELDATIASRDEFDRLFAHLKSICDSDSTMVSTQTAHARAVELDLKLRGMRSEAARLPNLESDRLQAVRTRGQQEEVQANASRLAIHSAIELMEKCSAQRNSIVQMEAKREETIQRKEKLLNELAEVNDAIRRLEDADTCYRQGREFHVRLCDLNADLAKIAFRDDLQDARDEASKRQEIASGRRREIEAQLQAIAVQLEGLRNNYGTVDVRVGSVAEQVDGHLLISQFEKLSIEEAARTQAQFGIWTEAIVVPSPERAAEVASEIEDRPDTLLFVTEEYVSLSNNGRTIGDSEIVSDEPKPKNVRLTRRPKHPILGRLAREAEVDRLEGEKASLETTLANLRSYSGLLSEILVIADRYLALGSAAWHDDPGPSLLNEQARSISLRTTQATLEVEIRRTSHDLAQARDLQQQYDQLEPRRELLDPPSYREKVRWLDEEIIACRSAKTWLAKFEQDVLLILEGLPILRTVPDSESIELLTASLGEVKAARQVAATSIDALEALLTVASDLRYDGDEVVYAKQSSVMASLKVKLDQAEARLQKSKAAYAEAKTAADSARRHANNQDAILVHCSAEYNALVDRLAGTGMLGTEEERDAASDAWTEARQALAQIGSAKIDTIDSRATARAKLSQAELALASAIHDTAERLQAFRGERHGKREMDGVVAEQNLTGKIDTEVNRQDLFPAGIRQIQAFELAAAQRSILLERLKAQPAVLAEIKEIDVEAAVERRAVQALKIWGRVLTHIEQRIPRNIASSDDPRIALAQMQEKLRELRRTLDTQEQELRQRSVGVSSAIRARLRTAGVLVHRLNRELETVRFGSIQGVHIVRQEPPLMLGMLKALEDDGNRSLFDTETPLDETLVKMYERIGGGQIKGSELLDYRNYLTLHLEVRRLTGAWDSTANLSTGEAIGVGAAILVMILRTWNEELRRISGKAGGYSMQQILLDEANRLDPEALDTLTEFCERMDVQALVAAPGLDQPRSSTVYTLARSMQDDCELVTIEGRRFTA
ncbi:SbcC/MukB-like Walker B domain-containing protein [Cupriavidus necator]